MAGYSEETREGHKAMVATAMILHPSAGAPKIMDIVNQGGQTSLAKDYVATIMSGIRKERQIRYLNASKEETLASFEEAMEWVLTQCRKIMMEETNIYNDKGASLKTKIYSQKNRLKALEIIVLTLEKVLNMKMDLGILERQIGTVVSEERVIDVMAAMKAYRTNPKQYEETDQRGDSPQVLTIA